MDNYERELILKCYNQVEQALPILHGINQFVFKIYCYEYLLKKGIIGENLVSLYQKLGNSNLKLGKYLIDKINIENRKMNIKDLTHG